MGWLGRALFNSRLRARAQRREIVPAFEGLGGRLDGCRVLEVGGGGGTGAELLLDQLGAGSVEIVELDPVMIRRARHRLGGRVPLVQGDMTRLPIAAGSYDAVIAIGAIHLADDWRSTIAEAFRVLRPGGRFYFEQPLNPWPRCTVTLAGGRFPGGFGRAELLDALDDVGFELVGSTGRGLARLDLIGVVHKPLPPSP
jgi:ubiquinone/menaquinone biosynthesis C-methylase UbiE